MKGYGRILLDGKPVLAHRVAFALHHGIPYPPTSVLIRHKCDTPLCCNPHHLLRGTHLDNLRDAVKRKRHWWQKRTHAVCGHLFTRVIHGRRECQPCTRAKRAAWNRAHPEVTKRAKAKYQARLKSAR